jgi:hypothetical protein
MTHFLIVFIWLAILQVLALLDLPLRIAVWMAEVNILFIYHLKLIL